MNEETALHVLLADRHLTDEEEWSLIALGANSVTRRGTESEIHLWGTAAELSAFSAGASQLSIRLSPNERWRGNGSAVRNWVQECPELMEPITVGSFRIVPLRDGEALPLPGTREQRYREPGSNGSTPRHTVFLRPGDGFGTGHHAATQLGLELLEGGIAQSKSRTRKIRTILDVGTGSGILAIAAHTLLPHSTTWGFDTDEHALRNAEHHLALNHITRGVELTDSKPQRPVHGFDLILANLYAPILEEYAEWFREITHSESLLVLSGILAEQYDGIVACYSPHWTFLEEMARDGWRGSLLLRGDGA